MHCADHNGHTWGDEANVTVTPAFTTLSTAEDGTGYTHESWPYANYSSFSHHGLWFTAIHRVLVGCCHVMGLYRVSLAG